MPLHRIKATRSQRGTHPDLDDSGELRPDTDLPLPQREFLRMKNDPARWNVFMQQVAARQALEHPDVQRAVAGRSYDGLDAYAGYQQYQQDLWLAKLYANKENELTSYDIERMTLEEYDRTHDEQGRPREGFSFRPTAKDVLPNAEAGIDRYSRGELGR